MAKSPDPSWLLKTNLKQLLGRQQFLSARLLLLGGHQAVDAGRSPEDHGLVVQIGRRVVLEE